MLFFLSVSRLMIGNNNAILVVCVFVVAANECYILFHTVCVAAYVYICEL